MKQTNLHHGISILVAIGVFTSLAAARVLAQENETGKGAAKDVIHGQIAQPTTIPGKWAVEQQPMPPLTEILAQAKPNSRIYGLYAWAGEYLQYRDAIKKVGWHSYRCGGPSPGGLNDKVMQAFAEDDTEVMYVVGIKPQKLDATPEEDSAFVQKYAEAIKELLGRYGPGGTFFRENPNVPNRPLLNLEIWNEPNFQYLITPDNRPQAELEAAREALYARLLPAAYTAVKACSKEVNVVGFGAGGASAGDIRFIVNVNKANPEASQSYDILSTHPYVEPAPPEAYSIQSWGRFSIASSLEKIRADLALHKRAGIPIWYTEIGWPISKQNGGFYPTTGTQVSPELQAAYICRLYAFAQRLGVLRVHIMSVNDTDTFNSGFFLRDGTWRPSAHAVQTMIKLMPAPRLLDAISDGQYGYFAYRFAANDDAKAAPVLMLWNVAGPKIVEVPMSSPRAIVVDMLGHAQEVTPVNGKVRIEIGPLPMYLREK